MSTTTVGKLSRTPVWPLLIAPLVASVYYLVLKAAFIRSIGAAVGTNAASTIALGGLGGPRWGSHWVYRVVAEVISIGISTFIAAGLARGRERVSAIIGGTTIALVFIAGIVLAVYVKIHMSAEYFIQEPWYQYVIDGLLVIGCPLIGLYAGEVAREINDSQPSGFAGISRLHFLWFWLLIYSYTLGLMIPIARSYTLETTSPGLITTGIDLMINGIPAAAWLTALYFGVALLSGQKGTALHSGVRNLLGVFVLVIGIVIGATVQFVWLVALRQLFG